MQFHAAGSQFDLRHHHIQHAGNRIVADIPVIINFFIGKIGSFDALAFFHRNGRCIGYNIGILGIFEAVSADDIFHLGQRSLHGIIQCDACHKLIVIRTVHHRHIVQQCSKNRSQGVEYTIFLFHIVAMSIIQCHNCFGSSF